MRHSKRDSKGTPLGSPECLPGLSLQELPSDAKTPRNVLNFTANPNFQRDIQVIEYDNSDSIQSTDPEPKQSKYRNMNFLEDLNQESQNDNYSLDQFVLYDKLEDSKQTKVPLTQRSMKSAQPNPKPSSQPFLPPDFDAPKPQLPQYEQDFNRCRRHGKNITAFCFTDQCFLCVECLLAKSHQKHHVAELSVALEARAREIERRMVDLKDRAPAKALIAELERRLEATFQKSIETNKHLFAEIRAVVAEQEKLFNVRTRLR